MVVDLPNCAVAVVGAMNMDIMVQTPAGLEPCDSTPGRITCAPGGVGRNVAENLARLGLDTRLYSLVGDDAFGQALVSMTREAGVDVSGVQVEAGCRSDVYLAWNGPDGDMLAAVNDMNLLDRMTPDAWRGHADALRPSSVWVLDCNLKASVLERLILSASGAVFVDAVSSVKCVRVRPWLSGIHLLKVNRREASLLTGREVQTVSQARDAAACLREAGVRQAVVSLGEQGLCWCDADGSTGHRPARAVAVVNTSGAGDALLAGLVLGFAHGLNLQRSVEAAMACAEITLASPHSNAPQLSVAAVRAHLGQPSWPQGTA